VKGAFDDMGAQRVLSGAVISEGQAEGIQRRKRRSILKRYRKLTAAVCILMIINLFGGCGTETEQESADIGYTAVGGMEDAPVVEYSVPRSLPNILVDTRGYMTVCEKQAAVKGHELPESFRLLNAETGEEVYRGLLDKVTYNEDLDLYTASACFDEFSEEGVYYLECDIIGQSYVFPIQASMYEELFQETYRSMITECREHTLEISDAFGLLLTYEWYGDAFADENGDQIPDVMKELQDWISFMEESELVAEDNALYAAFLAKFSYNYRKFDEQYATDCLRRASTVFGQPQAAPNKGVDEFLALTELYRATGLKTYRSRISDYKSLFEENESYLEDISYIYGAMTYMSTRQKVDIKLCQLLMNDLMNRGEEISQKYEDMIHPVAARNNGVEDLLKSAAELSCANYVLNSYQYMKITEEFLHYVMGQNVESVCFYPQEGDRSIYLLLSAQLAVMHRQPEEV
jgi:endoglucanase